MRAICLFDFGVLLPPNQKEKRLIWKLLGQVINDISWKIPCCLKYKTYFMNRQMRY
jgi:hypothetical protein